ncbi:MAG: CHASE domain-containing protein [Bacteroidota bacterium]
MRYAIPWVVLVLSLFMTAAAALTVGGTAQLPEEERVDNAVESMRNRIEDRLETYIALLRSGVGLFMATNFGLTADDFRTYTDHVDLARRYPGIQGIGFTKHVRPAEHDSLVDAMVRQGFDDFRIWPDTSMDSRHAIIYLEPLDERNRAAIGFDMSSEAQRRQAMNRACETGEPAMSGKVTLVQEIEGRVQAGFLIYLPLYSRGAGSDGRIRCPDELEGYIYAPFRADDAMADIFGADERPRLAFRIFDGRERTEEALLHDSRSNGIVPSSSDAYSSVDTVSVAGRTWTIEFAPTAVLLDDSQEYLVASTVIIGLLLSLLLFGLIRSEVQAGAASERSEQRLQAILEALPAGTIVADSKGQVAFTNSAHREIWSPNGDQLTVGDESFAAWLPGTDSRIESDQLPIARALRGEVVRREVVDIRLGNGQRKTILQSAFPIIGKRGGVEMAVGAEIDITEQKQAEAALRKRERELRSMIDGIPHLAMMMDARGGAVWHNQKWLDLTGMDREALQHAGWQSRIHPVHAERVRKGFQRALANGESWEDTFALQDRRGDYRQFLTRAVPIREDDGLVLRWLATSTDVTAQVQAREAEARAIREQSNREAAEQREEELRRHAIELERSNRELQDFAYVASHDLQEPLRKISTFTDLIIEEYGDRLDDDGREYLKRAKDAALRMSRLIKDLLAFSRIQTRTEPFRPVDLSDVVDDVLTDLDVLLESTGGRVVVESLPTLEADPVQMRQLFQNIIGNALKFHRPGVPPVVSLRSRTEEVDGQLRWLIEIEDNGIGFDEKYLDRIFGPFQRLHGRTHYDGTGMGLAICRRIVERHHGSITARSSKGNGATFEIRMPATQPA